MVRLTSGRDSKNNILVYWADTAGARPSDGASCWLYIARLDTWHENHFAPDTGLNSPYISWWIMYPSSFLILRGAAGNAAP